jgi:hypothetical protein
MSCKCGGKWCGRTPIVVGGFKGYINYFEEELPKDIRIIKSIESCFEKDAIRHLKRMRGDYLKLANKKGDWTYWTIPEKIVSFIREKKLKELGI